MVPRRFGMTPKMNQCPPEATCTAFICLWPLWHFSQTLNNFSCGFIWGKSQMKKQNYRKVWKPFFLRSKLELEIIIWLLLFFCFFLWSLLFSQDLTYLQKNNLPPLGEESAAGWNMCFGIEVSTNTESIPSY